MGRDLSGKVAIVTGAGSEKGIGAAIALGLVRAGARVAFVDLDQPSLACNVDDARAIGGPNCAIAIVANVADADDADRTVAQAIAMLGGLHILVNNAGTVPRPLLVDEVGRTTSGRSWEIPPEEWHRVVAVNVNGPFHFTRAAMPHLLRQGWGRIIGVTTSLDTMYNPGGVPYGPSKAAHEAMIAILARELADTGVTANVVTPGGLTNTNQARRATEGYGFSPADMLSPDVMAPPCTWLASDEADGFTDRRIVARLWDEARPLADRIADAAAPTAWQQLGAQAKLPAPAR